MRGGMHMKSWVFSAVLAVMLVPACAFGAPSSTTACAKQVHQKQYALEAAIRRYGDHSAQTDRARQALELVEARCLHH